MTLPSLWRMIRGIASQFPKLFLKMCMVIGALVCLEVIVLQWMGATYEAAGSVRSASLLNFSLSADGRWGASRVAFEHAHASRQPIHVVLQLHEMASRIRAVRLDVGIHRFARSSISPSGDQLAFTTWEGLLVIANLHDKSRPVRMIDRIGTRWTGELRWAADGRHLAAINGGSVYVWAMPSGDLLHELHHEGLAPEQVVFSEDGEKLLAAGTGGACLWDVRSGSTIEGIPLPLRVQSVALSADARIIVVRTMEALFARDLQSGVELWREDADYRRWSPPIALACNGSLVANIHCELDSEKRLVSQVLVRDIGTGQTVSTINPKVGWITGLLFASADTICAWGEKGPITCWDVRTRRETWRRSFL